MFKRITAALTAALIMLSAASCSSGGDKKSVAPEKATEKTTEETAAEEMAFDKTLLKEDPNGFLTYDDGVTKSRRGVDVSSYSGEVDWGELRAEGVDFAIVRAGGRGYGDEGVLYSDESAARNLVDADSAGIVTGAYFFSQAVSVEEAEEEADYVLSLIEGKNVRYVAYDFERIEDDDARTDKVADSEIPTFAKAFCNRVKSAGCEPLIYLDYEEIGIYSKVNDIPLWIADYETTPKIDDRISIWQYKKSVTIDAAEGAVDLNIMFVRR